MKRKSKRSLSSKVSNKVSNTKNSRHIEITDNEDGIVINFSAMASPCELHFQSKNRSIVEAIARDVCDEVWRIEDKYSRYNSDSLCSKINASNGKPVVIDNETFLLLTFSTQCYEFSDGLFDISSGILRQVWMFDGSDNIPTQTQISSLLPLVGWGHVTFDQQSITLAKGMEVDFGGIGKEYAVDKAIGLIRQSIDCAALVNLGGDLACCGSGDDQQPWQVGVEQPGGEDHTMMVVALYRGGLATSGDAKRFLKRDKQRFSHILNAKTGWPVVNPPRSITVTADTCMEAGVLAMLSMLQGQDAEKFLTAQDVQHWSIR